MRYSRQLYIMFLLSALSLTGCSRPFNSGDYWPMAAGNFWEYDSPVRRIEVSRADAGAGAQRFTLSYYDSTQMILWKEAVAIKQQGVFWLGLTATGNLWPEISFNPPLPLTPQSDQPEALYTVYGVEKRDADSVTIHVTYQVDGFETVETGAGLFSDCIKLSVNYSYSSAAQRPLLAGRSSFWFARGIGLVRFQMPSGQGTLTKYAISNKKSS